MIKARSDHVSTVFLGVVTAVAIVVPLLNLAVPSSSYFHISSYSLTLIGKYLC